MGVIVSRHVGTKKDLRSYLKSLERMTKFEICHVSNFKSWAKPGIYRIYITVRKKKRHTVYKNKEYGGSELCVK